MDMIDALCHRTCVQQLDMFGKDVKIAGEECFPDLHGREVDSKLAKFICSLPCLTNLTITTGKCVIDDFVTELASLAASSQIQTVNLVFRFQDSVLSHLASNQLAKFICSLPCLTNLTITTGESVIDDFVTELASLAASSQIQTVNLDFSLYSRMPFNKISHSASKQLAKFLCSLPCLTTLAMTGNQNLHDDFFTELGSLAASLQIQTVNLDFKFHNSVLSHLASKQLAKFICFLPCLTNLTIFTGKIAIDDFVTELASLAASLQIQTVELDLSPCFDMEYNELSRSASNQLAKFICTLPCLTNLTITMKEYGIDDFVTELASLAASSQN
eukprot:XP_011662726.1 PREDICTED: uncharacterized protein LOC105437619 [Strongylocentrotus purpuratus]